MGVLVFHVHTRCVFFHCDMYIKVVKTVQDTLKWMLEFEGKSGVRETLTLQNGPALVAYWGGLWAVKNVVLE